MPSVLVTMPNDFGLWRRSMNCRCLLILNAMMIGSFSFCVMLRSKYMSRCLCFSGGSGMFGMNWCMQIVHLLLTSQPGFWQATMNPLAHTKLDTNVDFVKGKMEVTHSFPMVHARDDDNVTICTPWSPPNQGHVKLNTDGSVLNGKAGSDMVLRDDLGSIIFNVCRYIGDCEDILESEIMAMREGISLALQWISLPIDVVSVCMEAVSMVNNVDHNLSKYSFLIREIKHSMGERDSSITHIQCTCNGVSHAMANFGRGQGRTMVWLGSAPDEVLDIAL